MHNETATGLAHPIGDIRKAMTAAKHPALLLADTISSLGSFDFRMDEWGVDIVVGGSQKGLMMVTGLSFTGISAKAMASGEKNPNPRKSYWDWAAMRKMEPQRFPGTTPVHLFYGIDEAVKVIDEEGLENVFTRHRRLANATRAAIAHWGGGVKSDVKISLNGMRGQGQRHRVAVQRSSTCVRQCFGHPRARRPRCQRPAQAGALDLQLSPLAAGLGPLAGRVFRIGHLGDLNEPMLLGALATVELALADCAIPHTSGGVTAAMANLRGAG